MSKKEKTFDLNDYLQSQQKTVPTVEYKDPEYIILPEPIQQAMGMPGYALGHMTMKYGLSDSGKTALLLAGVKAAIEQGSLPVLIITENKLNKARLIQAGIDVSKIILVEHLKCLEDVYDYISGKVQEVLDGKLPMQVPIFWDTVAGCPSKESFTIDANGAIEKNFDNRKNANVIGFYNNIIAARVAETRKKGVVGIVGVIMVTQAYMGEKPKFPAGLPAPILPNGGEKIWFPLSVALEIKEGKRLNAKHKGKSVDFGLVTKIKVKKNHISELNCEGEVVLAGSQVLPNDSQAIEDFKESKKKEWTELLEQASTGGPNEE